KDDNAHVEQKNWTHVRKLLGWDRYDGLEALTLINQLYEQLRIFQNLFQPSMKLRTKTRKGSRVIRRYDQPRTPWARVLKAQVKPFPSNPAVKSSAAQPYPLKTLASDRPAARPPLQLGCTAPWRKHRENPDPATAAQL